LDTENVALICKRLNIVMVHISTDGIFDGQQGNYNDYDIPNPLKFLRQGKICR